MARAWYCWSVCLSCFVFIFWPRCVLNFRDSYLQRDGVEPSYKVVCLTTRELRTLPVYHRETSLVTVTRDTLATRLLCSETLIQYRPQSPLRFLGGVTLARETEGSSSRDSERFTNSPQILLINIGIARVDGKERGVTSIKDNILSWMSILCKVESLAKVCYIRIAKIIFILFYHQQFFRPKIKWRLHRKLANGSESPYIKSLTRKSGWSISHTSYMISIY